MTNTPSKSASDRAALVRDGRKVAELLRELSREKSPGSAQSDADVATAILIDRLADALEAADEDTQRLQDSLRWTMREIADSATDENGMPAHNCEYHTRPDVGACEFHEQWVKAEELTGALAARAAEEPTHEATEGTT